MFITDQYAVRTSIYFMSACIEDMSDASDVCLDHLKMYQGR